MIRGMLLAGTAAVFLAVASFDSHRFAGVSIAFVGYTNLQAGIPPTDPRYRGTAAEYRFALFRLDNQTRQEVQFWTGPVKIRVRDNWITDTNPMILISGPVIVSEGQSQTFAVLPPHGAAAWRCALDVSRSGIGLNPRHRYVMGPEVTMPPNEEKWH
jgi:hypothetical protein